MSFEFIQQEFAEGVSTITLARPDKLNAFNEKMGLELQEALSRCAQDGAIRAVLLTGSGRGFCAGQDLAGFNPEEGKPLPALGGIIEKIYSPIVLALRTLEKPVVAAVNGIAAGAGANLAFACDIVLASKEASFVQSFAKVGLIPDCGGSFFLPRLVGWGRALALAMLAEKVSAEDAEKWGLVYKTFEAQQLMGEARKLANYLAQQPTKGLGLIKRAFNHSLDSTLEEQLAFEKKAQNEAGMTKDFAEGVRSFLERRPPRFTGN